MDNLYRSRSRWFSSLSVFGIIVASVALPAPTVRAAECCDVNLDGMTNVQDIVVMINHIVNLVPLTDEQLKNADHNCDGDIDILDVVGVVNRVTGGEEHPHEFAPYCYTDGDSDGCPIIDDFDDSDPDICQAILCDENQRVENHACVACPDGSTNEAGDNTVGEDTLCDSILCDENQRVANHLCVDCPTYFGNEAGDDASGSDTQCEPADADEDGYFSVFVGGYDCDDSNDDINVDEDFDLDCVEDGDDNCPFQFNPDQLDSNNNGIGDRCDDNVLCSGVFNAQLLCDDEDALNYCPPCDANPFLGETCDDSGEVNDCLSNSWKNSTCLGCVYAMPVCTCEPKVNWHIQNYTFDELELSETQCEEGSISYSGNGMTFELELEPFCEVRTVEALPFACPNGHCDTCQTDSDCTWDGQQPHVPCVNGTCNQCDTHADCPGPNGYCIDEWGDERPRFCGNSTCLCADEDPWAPKDRCMCNWSRPCMDCDGYCAPDEWIGSCSDTGGGAPADCVNFCNGCMGQGLCNGEGDTPLGTLCSSDADCKGNSNDGACQVSVCNAQSNRVGETCSHSNGCGNEMGGGRCLIAAEECCGNVGLRGYDAWPVCDEL